MPSADTILGPVAGLLDAIIPGADARDAAKLALVTSDGARHLDRLRAQLAADPATPVDPWATRARPGFLYVMYVLLLWSIPMGLVAAVRPQMAAAIARGMAAYFAAIPEPLYALMGTGYVGYTVARSWGKAKGAER